MNPVADSDRLHVLQMLECIQLVSEYTRLDRGTFFGSRMVSQRGGIISTHPPHLRFQPCIARGLAAN